MADAIDFQPYLKALLPDPANHDWGDRYTQTQVELPLKVQTIVQENSGDPTAQRQLEQQKRERFEVLEGLRKAVREHHQVLLIGKPGSGKSTALRRLLWEEAQQALEIAHGGQDNFTVPVLIELRDCRSGSVLEWIQKALRRLRLSQEAIEDLLFAGRLLLLFDGLNELPTSDAYSALDEFRRDKDFHTVPIIVTTRELGAGADLGIEKKLEMLPLTEPQMREFIQKRLPGQADNLLRQLQDRLRELAETPLLLQMLCDVVAESNDGQIPQNRGELFRQEFARRYESFKPLRGRVSEDSRRFASELLQHLAFVMTQGEPHTDPLKPTPSWLTISKTQAETILETYLTDRIEAPAQAAKEWLEDLLEFHLLQFASNPDEDEIEFHHQLFQEYYAAEKLLGMLQQGHPDLVNGKVFQYKYLNYLKWTEALKLTTSLLKNESHLVKLIQLSLKADLMLGAELINTSSSEFNQLLRELIQSLETSQRIKDFALIFTQPETFDIEFYNFINSESFDVLKDFKELIQALENSDPNIRECSLIELSKRYGQESIEALETFIRRELIPDLRVLAISILTKVGNIKSINVVEEALHDEDWLVRLSAVRAVASWKYTPLISKLIEMLKDSDDDVQGGVAQTLLEIGGEQAFNSVLESLSKFDEDYILSDEFDKFQIDNRFIAKTLEPLRSYPLNARKMAIERLINIGSKSALMESLKNLQGAIESEPWRWVSTTEALAAIGSENAIQVILEVLEDKLDDPNLLWTVADIVKRIQLSCAIPSLKKLIYKASANESIANALASLHVVCVLPQLVKLWEMNRGGKYREAISELQQYYQFYNYEIARSAVEEESGVSGVGSGKGAQVINNTYNVGTVGNLNTGSVTIHGNQIGEQHQSFTVEEIQDD